MKKKTRTTLLIAAVCGVALTGILVFQLTGNEEGGRAPSGDTRETRVASGDDGPAERKYTFPKLRPEPGGTGTWIKRMPGGLRNPSAIKPRDPAELDATQREIVELLEKILVETDQQKAFAAGRELERLVRLVGHQLDPVVIDRLFDVLQTHEPEQLRRIAGMALGNLYGHTPTAKRLIHLIKSDPDNRYTRAAIYDALGEMKVSQIIPDLMEMLGTGVKDEHQIVRTIGRIGGEDAADALKDRLDKPIRPQTRREIERLLGRNTNRSTLGSIRKDLSGADVQTRLSYLRILGMTQNVANGAAIRGLLEEGENDRRVVGEAIRALGRIGDPASADFLLQMAENDDPTQSMRARQAASALGRIRNATTLSHVAKRWNDLSDRSQQNVLIAGSRLPRPGEDLRAIAKSALEDKNVKVRTSAANLLGRRGRNDGIPNLVQFVADSLSHAERYSGLTALQKIGTKESAQAGLGLLNGLPESQRRLWEDRFYRILDK